MCAKNIVAPRCLRGIRSFVLGSVLVGWVLCLPGNAALAFAESQEEDGGDKGKGVTDLDRMQVRGVRGPGRGGGANLNRFSFSMGFGGITSPALHETDERGPRCEEGSPASSPETGHPVVIASGNKVLDETDFATSDGVFVFTRTYSKAGQTGGFGAHWRHPYSLGMLGAERTNYGNCPLGWPRGEPCPLGNRFTEIHVHRSDGVTYRYVWNSATGRYEDSRPESSSWIIEDEAWKDTVGGIGWEWNYFTLHREDGGTELYNWLGQIRQMRDVRGIGYTFAYAPMGGALQTVTHTSGRQIKFTFSGGKFTSGTDPAGKTYTYEYDGNRLVRVIYPDGLGTKTYHYEDASQPTALTGYSINGVRRTRYAYRADVMTQ